MDTKTFLAMQDAAARWHWDNVFRGQRLSWDELVLEDPIQTEHVRSLVRGQIKAAVEMLESLTTVGPQPLHLAATQTGHFEFQGAGATEQEALLALKVALERHCDQTPGCTWVDHDIAEMVLDAHPEEFEPGESYRDGEEIR